MIDFWGKGFDLIERMGLLPEVERAGYHIQEVRFVGSDGRRSGGFSTKPFWSLTGGRFTSLPRGELAKIIWNSLPDAIETRFGDEVVAIVNDGPRLRVEFARSEPALFDLVIGADGLHSRVRELLFGSESQFERFVGYSFAAFTADGYEPRATDVYVTYGFPRGSAARVAMRGGKTLILLLWREESPALPRGDDAKRALLRERFGRKAWELPRMIEALDRADDLYVDVVSQIRLPRWSCDGIALTGDAAWAPSFLAGEGCGLAIIGAYVLAGELARSRGERSAFHAYEQKLRPFMESKQKMAARFGAAFVPETAFGVGFRNRIASLLNIQPFANAAISSGLKDNIELAHYDRL